MPVRLLVAAKTELLSWGILKANVLLQTLPCHQRC